MKSGKRITIVWIPSYGSKSKTLDGVLEDISPTRVVVLKGDKTILIPLSSVLYMYQDAENE